MFDAKNEIDINFIKKVFAKRENKVNYLQLFFNEKKINEEIPSTINLLDEKIISSWDYTISKNIIRKMFKNTDKYKQGKNNKILLDEMVKDWKKLDLGEIGWPFSAMGFDTYIQQVNTSALSEEEKDNKVKMDSIRFRRIKRINTIRNDFIEYLVFEYNENIIPTLVHRKKVDFYIDGKPYDQKVSRSVTNQFKKDFGENWKNKAIEDPRKVAEYLYKYQDEERFGSEPRLLIVYLDSDIEVKNIIKTIKLADFKKPLKINFDYSMQSGSLEHFSTECFVVLLHK